MKRFLLLFVVLIPLLALGQNRADWANANPYADTRSLQPGGVLTVLIMEYSQAANQAQTTTRSDVKTNLNFSPTGTLATALQGGSIDMPFKHESQSNGGTTRSGSVTGKLSVTIKSIDASGNLLIEGKRSVNVNGDKQLMTLTGTVRPQDVHSDNTVFSYDIANADLDVSGKGTVNDAAKPGWLTRIFSWLL